MTYMMKGTNNFRMEHCLEYIHTACVRLNTNVNCQMTPFPPWRMEKTVKRFDNQKQNSNGKQNNILLGE